MFQIGYRGKTPTSERTARASSRWAWRRSGACPDATRPGAVSLDFAKPFLPETLAQVQGLTFLAPGHRRTLNQIRGRGYVSFLRIAEESPLPRAARGAEPPGSAADPEANPRAATIRGLRAIAAAFDAGFGIRCGVVGPPADIARRLRAHDPLAVALLGLQIALTAGRHAEENARETQDLDPRFAALLARPLPSAAVLRATMMVEALAQRRAAAEIRAAIDDYAKLVLFIDAGIERQAALDVVSLKRATGHALTDEERETIVRTQRGAMRRVFLGAGMAHPEFLATVGAISATGRATIETMARAFR